MNIRQSLSVWILIVGLGLFFGHNRITSFPKHVHAWAEGGQYAIALGFIDNGFDFFKPETFVLNPQFPGDNGKTTASGVTAVDFPIFQYLVAGAMQITGITSPIVYRLFVFLYSCLGLFLLFKSSYLVTQSLARSYLVLLFVISSPVFVYYQTGMLISMPALSTAFISCYFLIKHFKYGVYAAFIWAIVFITMAAAMRTTYLIFFCAIGLWYLIDAIKSRKFSVAHLLPFLIGLTFLIVYRYYNFLLAKEHGSIFLNQFLMASSLPEFIDYLQMTWSSWKLDYFSKLHYLIMAFLFIIGGIIYRKNKTVALDIHRKLFVISIAALLADVLFLIVMIRQFPQHDYYFLDSFFLPITLLLMVSISFFPRFRSKNLKYVAATILFIPAFLRAIEVQENRTNPVYWNEVTSTVNSLEGADALLDCLEVGMDAKVLILGSHGANLPLIQTRRKGYTLLNNSKHLIDEALDWDYDYLLLPHNLFLSEIYPLYPEIVHQFKRIGGNERLGVYKRNKGEYNKLSQFLGLNEATIVASKFIDFEFIDPEYGIENMRSSTKKYNGDFAYKLAFDNEYGLNIKFQRIDLSSNGLSALVDLEANLATRNAIKLIMVIKNEGEIIHYEEKDFGELIEETGSWKHLKLIYEIPTFLKGNASIEFYSWNSGGNTVYIDDLDIRILKFKKDCNHN